MSTLLSFAEAKLAGEAMFDRWAIQSDDVPPLERADGAWADMARVAWDTVQRDRNPHLTPLSDLGFPDYAYTPDFRVVRVTAARGTRVGKVLRPYVDQYGYVIWNLRKPDGRTGPMRRSAIVCTHFHGPRPAGMMALHNDGHPQNDSQDNLRWGTPADNMADMVRHGRAGRTRGQRREGCARRGDAHHNAKLTSEQVRQIRASALSGRALAGQFGVTPGNIHLIRRGVTWG